MLKGLQCTLANSSALTTTCESNSCIYSQGNGEGIRQPDWAPMWETVSMYCMHLCLCNEKSWYYVEKNIFKCQLNWSYMIKHSRKRPRQE